MRTPFAHLIRFDNKGYGNLKTYVDTWKNSDLSRLGPSTVPPEAIVKKFTKDLPYALRYQFNRYNPSFKENRDAETLYTFLTTHNIPQIRVELTTLGMYSNDDQSFRDLASSISSPMSFPTLHVPLKDNMQPDTIYHSFADKYEYKVTVGKINDTNLADYLEANNNNLIRIGESALESIRDDSAQYYRTYYFYVKNKKVLDLISLFSFEIARLEKLLPK